MEIKETTFTPKTYLVWRKEIDVKNITDSSMWQTAYGKVHEYIKKHNIKITGPGAALYFRWDEPKGKGEIGIGHPVDDVSSVDDPNLSLVDVVGSEAVTTTVHGAYENFPEHHSSLAKHLKELGAKETLVIEEYIVTGMDNPDSKNWETNIYHLYE